MANGLMPYSEYTEKWRQNWAELTLFLAKQRLYVIFGGIYLILSLFVMLDFLHNSLLGDIFSRTAYNSMMDGTAYKPFIYRQLISLLTQGIAGLTPDFLREWIGQGIRAAFSHGGSAKSITSWLSGIYNEPNAYMRVITTLLIYASLWGYIWALYRLAESLFPSSIAIRFFAPIFGMLIIPSFSWQWLYIYDIPVLFLSTACYYTMVSQRWRHYLIFFTLACLNKESSIFILLFFLLWFYSSLEQKTYWKLLGAQALIYLAIKIVVTCIFFYNRGSYLEQHLSWVMTHDLLSKSNYARILVIAGIFFILTFRWPEKPAFLKCGLWLIPPFYLSYLFFGVPGEYRVFFDIMPLLVLLGTHTLIQATDIAKSPFFRTLTIGSYDAVD